MIDEFNKLPGIGRKSATRLAFHILEMSEEQVEKFFRSYERGKKKQLKKCPVCGDFCENDLCNICADETRDKEIVCVVEDSRDINIILRKQENTMGLIMY